jgi:hypothetical protein
MILLFVLWFSVACTALALWVDVRFESKRPSEIRFAILHVATAWFTTQFLVVPGMLALANAGHAFGAVILIALPGTVYCLLSVVWLMRVCAGALGNAGLRN